MQTKKKITDLHIVTLGCSKNLVDSEVLAGQLNANNLKVYHNDEQAKARNVIINTCGFIGDAKEESVDTILAYLEAKERGDIDNVFVMGCLSERYADELRNEIPEVDQYFGVKNIDDIVNYLGFDYKENLLGERQISTPSHYAYLKISEGCDRNCSFCAIPLIRGKHISKPIEQLVEETKLLVGKGVKEIILIAQDLTYYGVDIYKKQNLAELLIKLSDIQGVEWLRLHYAYPAHFPKDVIQVMKERDNICNYLDIPFQHITDNVLKDMRRNVTGQETYDLINYIKEEIPDITLRTTLLTGFPNESEDDFEKLLDFVERVKFDRLGVFAYSEEEDTYAAEKFEDNIPDEIKLQRVDEIMALQEDISLQKNQEKVGKTYKTMIDRVEDGLYIGRTQGDSPEVDNEVIIETKKALKTGDFVNIKIERAEEFDLFGFLISD